VDVQENRIEIAVWGYGADDELWLVDSVVIDGEVQLDRTWDETEHWLFNARYKTLNGVDVPIRCIAVDSGWGSYTERVYRFVNQMKARDTLQRTIIATKGQQKYERFISDRPKLSAQYNQLFHIIGTDIAKGHLALLLANTEPGPGYVHLPISLPTTDTQPRWLDKEVLVQLTSEKRVVRYKNGKVMERWEKIRPGIRNEQWDMLIMSYAAVQLLGPENKQRLGQAAELVASLNGSQPAVTSSTPTSPQPVNIPSIPQRVVLPVKSNRDLWSI
jgi:phage terminase large subunit GpA-like protein